MDKEFLYMQKLAGLITENQYKKLLEDISLVDKILDKISKKGIESLSPQEKKYIDQYSKGETPEDWRNHLNWENEENYYAQKKDQELFDMLKNAGVNVKWIDYSELGTSNDVIDNIEVSKDGVQLIIGYEIFRGGEGFIIETHGDIGNYEAIIDRILFDWSKGQHPHSHLTTKEAFDAVMKFVKTDFKKIKPPKESEILKSLGFKNYYKGSEALIYELPKDIEYYAVPVTEYYVIRSSEYSMNIKKKFKDFKEFVEHFKKNIEGKYPNKSNKD